MVIKLDIPGSRSFLLHNLVLDYNGTLAEGGALIPGVASRINELATKLNVYILTADTFGTVKKACASLPAEVRVLDGGQGAKAKEMFVRKLGEGHTVAIGNGANDSLMLKLAALGILIIGPEGAAVNSLLAAEVVVTDINHALDLLLEPKRLVATLRN